MAEVSVRNTGSRPARETVQLYISDLVTSVSWAEKELKAYRQVDVAPGRFRVLVGPSSRDDDLLAAEFTVR